MKLITRDKKFMNTTITFKIVQTDEPTVKVLDGIEEGFGEFDRIVKQYTRFDEGSELSDLNRHSGEWFKVNDEFFELIKYMLNLSEITDGAFDPTVIDFLEVYGYDKKYDFSKLDNPDLDKRIEEIARTRKSWKEIKVDEKTKMVKLSKGQRIDLGGVGKGYAIDCAFEKLESKGLKNFLIDAGGDIRAKGKNEKNEYWQIALKNENSKGEVEIVGMMELKDESIASSGSWSRRVKQFHHLINPRTGLPENKLKTVYVQAKKAIDSDSWATALFVAGEEIHSKMPEGMKYFFMKN